MEPSSAGAWLGSLKGGSGGLSGGGGVRREGVGSRDRGVNREGSVGSGVSQTAERKIKQSYR